MKEKSSSSSSHLHPVVGANYLTTPRLAGGRESWPLKHDAPLTQTRRDASESFQELLLRSPANWRRNPRESILRFSEPPFETRHAPHPSGRVMFLSEGYSDVRLQC